MTDPATYHARAEALSEALQARLGVRGRGLEARLRRAGRRLPAPARRAGREIVEAGRKIEHPKLARMIDAGRVDAAFDTVNRHLKGIDRAEARRGALLGLAGALVFNLLLLAFLVGLLMRWQGLI